MWHHVAEWTYAICNTTSKTIAKYEPKKINKNKHQPIKSIAVVNVKKSGGQSVSEWEDLVNYVQKDKDYIKEEIEIIGPKIIVCGNNCSFLKNIYGDSFDLDVLHRDYFFDF